MASLLSLDLTTSRSKCSTCTQNNSCTTFQTPILVLYLSLFCTHTHFLIDAITSVAISADGRFIVSGSNDKSIKIFNMDIKQQLYHFSDTHSGTIYLSLVYMHTHFLIDTITSVAIPADGRFIVSGSADNSIKVLDMHTKEQLHHFSDAHFSTISFSILYIRSLPNR